MYMAAPRAPPPPCVSPSGGARLDPVRLERKLQLLRLAPLRLLTRARRREKLLALLGDGGVHLASAGGAWGGEEKGNSLEAGWKLRNAQGGRAGVWATTRMVQTQTLVKALRG